MRKSETTEKRRTVRDLWPLAAVLVLVIVTAGALAIIQPSLHHEAPFQARARMPTPVTYTRGESITEPSRTSVPRAAEASDGNVNGDNASISAGRDVASLAQESLDGGRQTGPPPESRSSEAPQPEAFTTTVPARGVAPSADATPSGATPPPPSALQPTVTATLPPRPLSVPPSPTAPAPTADPEPTAEESEPTATPTPSVLDDVLDLLPLDD